MKNRDLTLFLIASACIGISQSIDSAVFNNYLNDVFHITVSQRTLLEFPREFPGFIVVFVSGLLLFLGDTRVAALANVFAAVGMASMGFLSGNFAVMVVWMTVYSMGQHLFMPVSSSIGMSLASSGNMGKVLGKINGLNTAAFLVTSLLTAAIFRYVKVNYRVAFLVGSVAFIASAVLIFMMTPQKRGIRKERFILRKEYRLFYFLSIIFGARKQVFITFGPWVLIKVFGQGVSTFAVLGFIIAGIGMFFKPYVGHLIDKKGERFILAGEAAILILICLGYAFAGVLSDSLRLGDIALLITCACFIIDQLLMAAGMARSTYLKKIALSPEDVSPTLSMGISIDHAVSMVVPWLGSLVWNAYGYEYVFMLAAAIAFLNLLLTRRIVIPEPETE